MNPELTVIDNETGQVVKDYLVLTPRDVQSMPVTQFEDILAHLGTSLLELRLKAALRQLRNIIEAAKE